MTLNERWRTDNFERNPLFAILDATGRNFVRSLMTQRELERGWVLFREGERGESLFVIVEGRIKVGRSNWDGRQNVVAILGPGELFGELSVFDGGPRTMTATAIGHVLLLELDGPSLDVLLFRHPEVGRELLRSLAGRLCRTNDSMADLVFLDVAARVAKVLLNLAERFGRLTVAGLMIYHELRQDEVANLVGTSRETANRALVDFARRGWLTYDVGQVCIKDLPALRRRAGEIESLQPVPALDLTSAAHPT